MSAWLARVFDGIDLVGLLFICCAIGFCVYVWKIDQRRGNKFFLIDFITDANGRADKYSLGYVLILLVGTWVMYYLTLKDRLTEWFVTAFLGAFVIGSIVKTSASVYERTRDVKRDPDAPANETTTHTETLTHTEGK